MDAKIIKARMFNQLRAKGFAPTEAARMSLAISHEDSHDVKALVLGTFDYGVETGRISTDALDHLNKMTGAAMNRAVNKALRLLAQARKAGDGASWYHIKAAL